MLERLSVTLRVIGRWSLGSLECGHGGERRTRWSRQGRDDLGRHRWGGGPAGVVAWFPGGDHGRRLHRLLLREEGGRGGTAGGGALRARRRGGRRAGVRTRIYAGGARGGAGHRGCPDRRYPLGGARYTDLSRRGLDLLPPQPRSLGGPSGYDLDPRLNGGRSLGEQEIGGISCPEIIPSLPPPPRSRRR